MASVLMGIDTPCNWSYSTQEVELFKLKTNSSEYFNIKCFLTGRPRDRLEKICRVQNPYLYKRYELRKAEYSARNICFSEKQLFHATASSKVMPIISDNLDWRKVFRCKFGKGVSFSDSTTYANRECSRSNGYNRAIIVAKVLVGVTEGGSCLKRLPSKSCDTTVGNNTVFVKYYDDEFYPEYVAYYTD